MAELFRIDIMTPQKGIYHGTAVSLVAPAAFGYLGVLAHHAPLMTTLSPGAITVRDGIGATHTFTSKGGGFIEVAGNAAILLGDAIEPAGQPVAAARKETA